MSEAHIAEFLVLTAKKSDRPKAVLTSTTAAISSYYKTTEIDSPINSKVNKLVEGLIKCETKKPLRRTAVMPTKPFLDMFRAWGKNNNLSIWALRLKSLSLLSLAAMMRPSDLAPKSVTSVEDTLQFIQNELKRSAIELRENDMILYLFGIKNDYSRDGFQIILPRASDPLICPVDSLQCYIHRTQSRVKPDGAVFVGLSRPFSALSAGGIASILTKAIELAGLSGRGFTPKCFRPTGATSAIEAGIQPDTVRSVGRWKSAETFEKHYVHAIPPSGFTDEILHGRTQETPFQED